MADGTIKQYGAIPFVREDGTVKVVLITSANGYWIFPKGNFEEKHGKIGTARLEAFEEAGVKGRIDSGRVYRANVAIGSGKRARLILFPLEVSKLLKKWPEDFRRERRIVTLPDADRLIMSDGLKKCLTGFARDYL